MESLKVYRGYPANLFPLRRCIINDPASKRPLITDWRNAAFADDELTRYDGHGIGWALSTDDLIIDVDAPTPQRPGKRGLLSLEKLERHLDISLEAITTSVVSPSGGKHFYLTKPPEFKTQKALHDYPDIDFLTAGCYVVIGGSPHWQGGLYQFSDLSKHLNYARAEAPEGLLDLILRREVDNGNEPQELDGNQVAKLLSFLDPCDYREHDNWFQVMAACHSATAGSEDGREAFVAWSTSDPKFSNAGNEIKHRWNTLRPGGGITLRTLYSELKRLGRDGYQSLLREFDISKEFDVVTKADLEELGLVEAMPRVEYGLNEMRMNAEIIEALVDRPNLYQRLGSLADVVFLDGTPTIRTLKPVQVRELVSGAVQLGNYKFDKETKETVWAPKRVTDTIANAVAGRGYWEGIPFLKGIIESPAFFLDGSILQTPGFDAESGLYYSPTIDFPRTKDEPTKDEAAKALASLADVVCDFPFKSEAHRNVFVAAILTMVSRYGISGPVPLTFIDGNGKGVGKTLLADAISLIGAGRSMPKSNYPNNDAEMSKQITAIAMAGFTTQLIDNVPNGADFGFASLDAALTSDTWQGRILGRSEIIRMPLKTIFYATGNGLTVSNEADTIRRISYCQLDFLGESPDTRKEFKHGKEGQFRKWIVDNRGQFVNDALTILRAYHVSGETAKVQPWGSYNEWSEMVRAPLVWLGTADPIEARADLTHSADQGRDDLAVVLDAISEVCTSEEAAKDGVTATELRDKLYLADFSVKGAGESILAARNILCPKTNTSPASIGRKLTKHFKERTYRGRRLVMVRSGGGRRWILQNVPAA